MAVETSFDAVPLSTFVSDYSNRSLYWASFVFAITFLVTFIYVKFRYNSCELMKAPGSNASNILVAYAIVKAVCKNKIVPHNVGEYSTKIIIL